MGSNDSREDPYAPHRRRSRFEISRRFFLSGSSVVAVTLPQVLAAAPEVQPLVERRGKDIIVQFPGSTGEWRISPGPFNDADLYLSNGPPWTIRFGSDATYRGSELSAFYAFNIYQSSGSWRLKISYQGLTTSETSLAAWIAGQPAAINVPQLSFVTDGIRVNSQRSAPGTLDKVFRLEVKAGFTIAPRAFTATAGLMRVEPNAVLSDDARRLLAGDWQTPGSKLTFEQVQLQASAVETELSAQVTKQGLTKAVTAARRLNKAKVSCWLGASGGNNLLFTPDAALITLETVFGTGGDKRGVISVSSRGEASLAITGDGLVGGVATLALDDAVFFDSLSANRRALKARIAKRPQAIATGSYTAQIKRISEEFAWLETSHVSEPAVLPVDLLVLHAPTTDASFCQVDFRRSRSLGLDPGRLPLALDNFSGVPCTLSLARAAGQGDLNQLHVGVDSLASVSLSRPGAREIGLDTPLMRMRRYADGFDLGFHSHGYRLLCQRGASTISADAGAQRSVRFWPQHLQEEVFRAPPGVMARLWGYVASPFTLTPEATCPPEPTARELGTLAAYSDIGGAENALARTRVAGPSRIVFEPTVTPVAPRALSIAAMTDWGSLRLAVSSRARGEMALLDQLKIPDIVKGDSVTMAQGKIAASLKAPTPKETALEMVTGLVFSPDNSACFLTPQAVPGTDGAPLWSAQLELAPPRGDNAGIGPQAQNASEAKVRAVWSSGFVPARIGGSGDLPCETRQLPFATSINRGDRDEIMMLSSAYGLAALRAVTLAGSDVPQSLVRRPPEVNDFTYLSRNAEPIPNYQPPAQVPPLQPPLVYQEGVMSPAPFQRFAATLTAYGGDLDAEWQGEPAAGYEVDRHPTFPNKAPFFRPAFTIEKYVHRTNLGSDVFAEVVYKGFLFPYGFRVSLIKVTEREAAKLADTALQWMAPAIQRLFILPKPVTKPFPGIYQPYDGREIPILHNARLVSGLTPELEIPVEIPGLFVPPTDPHDGDARRQPSGRIFWPRARPGGTGTEILFEFVADGSKARRTLPMIFVDNAAAHDPAAMRRLVEFYNNKVPEALRTERHGGGQTVYAPFGKTGETSYQTERLLLKARGRQIVDSTTSAVVETYAMNAFMEGADEPPFYPVMDEAKIVVQSLDRFVGSPQGAKRVGFDGDYVRYGFDVARNPAELYLRFLDQDGMMELGGRGEISGGFAQTPTPLAGISRANAIVGAKPAPLGATGLHEAVAPAPTPSAPPAPQPLPAGADDRSPFNMSTVKAGQFSVSEFLHLPKLFGVIDVGELVARSLISRSPKLKETSDYLLNVATKDADAVLDLFKGASTALAKVLHDGETKLGELLPTLPPSTPGDPHGRLKNLYPELIARLEDLQDALSGCGALNAQSDTFFADLMTAGGRAVTLWGPLSRDIQAVIDNPMPAVLGTAIADLRSMANALRDLCEGRINTLFSDLIDTVLATALEPLFLEIIRTGQFDAFFGSVALQVTAAPVTGLGPPVVPALSDAEKIAVLRRLVRDPHALLPRIRDTLLADGFGLPLARLLSAVAGIEAEVIGTIAGWSSSEAADAICDVLAVQQAVRDGSTVTLVQARAVFIKEAALAIAAEFDARLRAFKRIPTPSELSQALATVTSGIATQQLKAVRNRIALELRPAAGTLKKALDDKTAAIADIVGATLPAAIKPTEKRLLELKLRQLRAECGALQATLADLGDLALLLANPATLLKAVESSLRGQVDRLIEQAAAQGRRTGVDLSTVAHRIEITVKESLRTAIEIAPQVLAATAARALLCATTPSGKPRLVELVLNFAQGLLPTTDDIHDHVEFLASKMDAFGLAGLPDDPAVAAVRQAGAGLRAGLARLANRLEALERLRLRFAVPPLPDVAPVAALCDNPNDLLDSAAQLYSLRAGLIDALEDCAKQATRIANALIALPPTKASAATAALELIRQRLGRLAAGLTLYYQLTVAPRDDIWTKFKIELNKIAAAPIETAGRIKAALQDVQDQLTKVQLAVQAIITSATEDNLNAVIASARLLVSNERRLLSAASDAAPFIGRVEALASDALVKPLRGIVKPLALAHGEIATQLKKILELVGKPEPSATATAPTVGDLLRLLAGPVHQRLQDATGAVAADQKLLADLDAALAINLKTALPKAQACADAWRDQGLGIVAASKSVEQLFTAISTGQLGVLFDFASVRTAIENAVRHLIPARVNLNYSWDTKLGPFPSGDPIFDMAPDISANKPDDGLPDNDLALSAAISIDLLPPKDDSSQNVGPPRRSVVVSGRVRPFKIRLLGSAFDLVTLYFSEARFKSVDGAPPKLDIAIARVEIGPLLKFLQSLGPALGGGKGFSITPTFAPPGVEARYDYPIELLPVGQFSFQNLAISISARLPFTDQQALFRFALSTREKPFLVSSGIYGGGGYVGLLANARGIVGFEIQLEFGAVSALRFGPLDAHGWITAGLYLSAQESGGRVFEGFVHAVGEGQIACFGVSVNIEVKVTQRGGGTMQGSSTYSFSFSVGLATLEYSFEAQYSLQGSGGGGGAGSQERANALVSPVPGHLVAYLPSRESNWKAYRAHFVKDWDA